MIRHLGFWLALLILAGGITLHTSLKSRQQEDRLTALKAETDAERDRIRVLTAEWASLTAPARLEQLAGRHLPLHPTDSTQIAALSDLPDRLAPAPAAKPTPPPAPEETTPPVAEQPDETTGESKLAEAAPPPPPPAKTRKVAAATPRPTHTARPAKNDGISELIERDAPRGILWANVEGHY